MKICEYYNNSFNIIILNKAIVENKLIGIELPERYTFTIVNIYQKFLWDAIEFPKKYKKEIISLRLQDRNKYLMIQDVFDIPFPKIHIYWKGD